MPKPSLKVKFSFSSIIMIIALILTHSYLSLAAILAAFFHELGHIIAAKICKIPLQELRLGIFGASLTSNPLLCSYKSEVILALAGPLVNLFSVALLLPVYGIFKNEFCSLFIAASLFLGILNLLPIYEFDGGRILYCALSHLHSQKLARQWIFASSFILIFSLWTLSIYLLLRLSSSLSLFIFSLSLFSKIFLLPSKELY